MTNHIRINDYETEAVRVYLNKEDLNLLYSFAVKNEHCELIHSVLFQPDSILVSCDVVEEVIGSFEHLCIYPDVQPNGEWYELVDGRSKDNQSEPDQCDRRIEDALETIKNCGGIDGAHHKQWVLDQVVRILSNDYDEWVKDYEDGEDGPQTYLWNEGIAP